MSWKSNIRHDKNFVTDVFPSFKRELIYLGYKIYQKYYREHETVGKRTRKWILRKTFKIFMEG